MTTHNLLLPFFNLKKKKLLLLHLAKRQEVWGFIKVSEDQTVIAHVFFLGKVHRQLNKLELTKLKKKKKKK